MQPKSIARLVYRINNQEKILIFEPTGGTKNEDLEIKSEKEFVGNSGRLKMTLHPQTKLTIVKFELEFSNPYAIQDKIFCNGYQSWTDSREFRTWEKMENVAHFLFELTSRSGDYTFYPYSARKGNLHGYTYTYIRPQDNPSTLYFYGSLDERCGYTVFQHRVAENKFYIIKDISGLEYSSPTLLMDLFASVNSEELVFDHYWRSFESPKPKVNPVTGWTSWYNHYTKITPEIIRENLKHFVDNKIPIDVFQVDDGYQKATGDWINTNKKFPLGMKPIAEAIQLCGFKAGLWLAPFICEKNSYIFQEHPDWIVSPDGEHPLKAGYNPLWSGWYYALNIYKPEVRAYLKTVFDTIFNAWGFDMVKLDFLFAPALIPQNNKSRGQIMCEGMDLLRELCGNKIILGCGVPLGPAFGKVDYCRIGNDIGLNWETKWMKNLKIRERVSTESSLTSTIGRHQQNGNVFFNDPDVFILRRERNQLSANQRNTLFVLNHVFGGLVFTSDDISRYDAETLNHYRKAFPHLPKTNLLVKNDIPLYAFQFQQNGKTYFGFSNFSKKPLGAILPEGKYFESGLFFVDGKKEITLEPYQTLIFLKLDLGKGKFLGSTLHIFPGCELELLEFDMSTTNYKINQKNKAKGTLFFDGGNAENLIINGKSYPVYQAMGLRIASVDV